MRRRCFQCKSIVDAEKPESVTCSEHLFVVFLCSKECAAAHKAEHEKGGVVE